MADLAILTNPKLQAGVTENFLTGDVLPAYLLANNPIEFSNSTVDKVVKYKSSAVGGAFNGLTQFPRTQVDAEIRLAFQSRQEEEPIVLDQVQLDKNARDPQAAVRLESYAIARAEKELRYRVGSRLYGIGGTTDATTGGTIMEGLRTIVDDGTDNDSIGGQSRTTYTALKGQYLAAGATLSSSNVANVGTYFDNATFGGDMPTHIFTTRSLHGIYRNLISLTQFMNASMVPVDQTGRNGIGSPGRGIRVNIGVTDVYFQGAPVIADTLCPATYWFMLNLKNQDAIVWAGLKSTEDGAINLGQQYADQLSGPFGEKGAVNLGLSLRKSMMSPNQYGKSTDIILMGCLASFEPRLNAKIKWA